MNYFDSKKKIFWKLKHHCKCEVCNFYLLGINASPSKISDKNNGNSLHFYEKVHIKTLYFLKVTQKSPFHLTQCCTKSKEACRPEKTRNEQTILQPILKNGEGV